ncbi:methyltransferase domain-containing protein [Rhodovibrionaceae bacterium A322]
MQETLHVFDRQAVQRQRDRAAAAWPSHSFLVQEIAERLLDRLQDLNRSFPRVLDLGCHGGELAGHLLGHKGIEEVVQCDLSPLMARRAGQNGQPTVAASEEALPFAPKSFDLVISNLSLHWVNDLPGSLVQIHRCLKDDGLFLGALLGGESLHELRVSLMEGEIAVKGGLSPRVSPLADVRDAGALLQRAGFALPVVDRDEVTVTYGDPFSLMRELRGMGETNALQDRVKHFTARSTLLKAAEVYHQRYATDDGRLPLTFQILFMTGWTPHESQQQPLRPGSAAARLAEALDSDETPAGDQIR